MVGTHVQAIQNHWTGLDQWTDIKNHTLF